MRESEIGPSAREKKQTRRLRLVLLLVTCFCGAELAGAAVSRSAVLRADALHLLLDVFALALSLGAMRLAEKPPTRTYTFGFRRAEALAAVVNGFLVLGVALEIVKDGVEGFTGTERPDAHLMLLVALVALVVNGASAWLLHGALAESGHDSHAHSHAPAHSPTTVVVTRAHAHEGEHRHAHAHGDHDSGARGHDHGHALNLRGALLHLVGDALGAVAAVVAAVVIRFDGPTLIDPVASVFVALILFYGAVRLLRDAARVLLEGAPLGLDPEAVRTLLAALPGVTAVHDLKVWTLGGGHDAIAVRLIPSTPSPTLAEHANRELRRAFSVRYAIVQVDGPPQADVAPRSGS